MPHSDKTGLCRTSVGRVSRRTLLGMAAGSAALSAAASDAPIPDELDSLIAKLSYLTPDRQFVPVERGDPIPYKQPEAKLREIGMTRDTWKLEVVPEAGARIENPMTKERGNSFDFTALMRLGETKSVRYLKVMTCNNLNAPLGMGLWEGVPLRELIWLAKPVGDIRRVYYYGHHNEDPKQMFRSSLSISRVMEEPPGDYPVILCYKVNGQFLSGSRGGPVRMLVPEAYGFKSVKWLQRIVITNQMGANDTYAEENNDIDSWMKTFARFLSVPKEMKAGEPIPITGVAQAGVGGLAKVQVWAHPQDRALPAEDRYFARAPWQDARILPPPERWGGELTDQELLKKAIAFDPLTGRHKSWPMRYAIAHWATLVRGLPPGKYDIRCRTIDNNGAAQPMPRPFGRGGINFIDAEQVIVKPA